MKLWSVQLSSTCCIFSLNNYAFLYYLLLESVFFPAAEKLISKRCKRTAVVVLYVCCVFGIRFDKIMKFEVRGNERFWKFIFFVVREWSTIRMFSGSVFCAACSLSCPAVSAVLQSTPRRYTGNSPTRFLNSVVWGWGWGEVVTQVSASP